MTSTANSIPILPMWVEQILAYEHDDVRFEAFANDIASILEGQPIVGTSASWDLGRDGRGLGPRHGVFVLATLRTDTDKAKTDASRLKAQARRIRRVYYVAPRLTSEAILEKHCAEIRSILGNSVVVDAIGQHQILDLVTSGKADQHFRRHYSGELDSLKIALATDTDAPHSKHFELALCTFGAENTQELRQVLTSRLILDLLDEQPRSLGGLAEGAARLLGVAAFSESCLQHYCEQLRDRGHVDIKQHQYEITDSGKQKLESGYVEVVASELSGRDAVRKAVEESLGNNIPRDQWNAIWNALQKKLAHAFYNRGKQILAVISTLLNGDDTSTVRREVVASLMDELLLTVISTYVAVPNRDRMLRAFKDAFMPGDAHGAFAWLAGVAGRFAATCTLGLSPDIASVLRVTLKRIRYFVDTDVVISYLCAHEPSHAAAQAVVQLNRRLTNQIMVTDAVVEETARHAMKAYVDYRVRVESVTGALKWYEIADLESAFTREFEYLRNEGKVKARDWRRFILRYAGEDNRGRGKWQRPNMSKMRSLLSSESLAIRSPESDNADWRSRRDLIEGEIFEDARRRRPGDRRDITKHKSRIDAEMLMTMLNTMTDSQAAGRGERYVLITSARRLQNLPEKVETLLRDRPEVLSLAEAATIAAFLPECPMSLQALQAVLFEGHFEKAVGDLEEVLLRIVRESSSAVLPGATRGVLCEEFGTAIIREARRTGEAPSDVRQRINRDPIEFARVAAVAIDALALNQPIEREDVMRRLEEAVSQE